MSLKTRLLMREEKRSKINCLILGHLFLNLKEANVFNSADWSFPKSDQKGLLIKKNKLNYKKNFSKLKLHLSKLMNIGDTIYTHNPWGEYGHEEHVQVFKAIYDLKKKI